MTTSANNAASRAVLHVGLCQIQTEAWDVEGNFQRTIAALRQGAAQGAELLITPECVFHGYAFDDKPDLAGRTLAAAETIDSPRIAAILRLARELNVDIMLGFAEKGESGRVHNSAAFIGREGKILWTYRKIHCRNFESAAHQGFFTPGDRFYASTRKYREAEFNIGAMICFDREVTESVRCLRALGAEFIACPLATDTFDPYARDQVNNEMVTCVRAAENELCIAVVNHAARFNGGSFIVGPMGEVVCQLGSEAEVRVVAAPVGKAKELHANSLGWMGWGYRRPEVFQQYLG